MKLKNVLAEEQWGYGIKEKLGKKVLDNVDRLTRNIRDFPVSDDPADFSREDARQKEYDILIDIAQKIVSDLKAQKKKRL